MVNNGNENKFVINGISVNRNIFLQQYETKLRFCNNSKQIWKFKTINPHSYTINVTLNNVANIFTDGKETIKNTHDEPESVVMMFIIFKTLVMQ